ncbi:MAG: HEAT repeat domain-containing protein [Planctomycetota bacterium]|jgi:hypothetical protein
MKQALVAILIFAVGAGAGALVVSVLDNERDGRAGRKDSGGNADVSVTLQAAQDKTKIDELSAELERLRALLAAQNIPEETPWPNDTVESVERLLQDAYQDNNVDWLLEVIERLLLLEEKGYPLLRRLIEDIAFKGKFLPTGSDFRMDQIYGAGKIFTNHEKQFIGFLNYLLVDNRTLQVFKQGAMMGAAFYVGSKAPGTEQLRETLIRQFLEGGNEGMGLPMIPKNAQEKMQVMAMAMSGDKSVIPHLQDKLKTTKDKNFQGDIIKALAYLGDESTIPIIEKRLDPNAGDFRDDLDALARIDTPQSHEVATRYLSAITNSKSFYRHASRYTRSGGGLSGIKMIQDRVKANPSDPDVTNAIGTLRSYPTQDSLDTLNMIAQGSGDDKLKDRATQAAEDVQRKLSGELPDLSKMNWGPRRRRR